MIVILVSQFMEKARKGWYIYSYSTSKILARTRNGWHIL